MTTRLLQIPIEGDARIVRSWIEDGMLKIELQQSENQDKETEVVWLDPNVEIPDNAVYAMVSPESLIGYSDEMPVLRKVPKRMSNLSDFVLIGDEVYINPAKYANNPPKKGYSNVEKVFDFVGYQAYMSVVGIIPAKFKYEGDDRLRIVSRGKLRWE